MAEKTILTRIINKNDSLANWTTNDPVLKQGEIALAYIETTTAGGDIVPTYLMKVGHGEKKFSELKWLAAPASDVYAWAKSEKLSDVTEFSSLSSTVGTNKSDISTLKTDVANIKQLTGTTGVAAQITAAIEALDSTSTGTGTIVKSVVQTDGKVAVTMGTLSADEIPTITVSKISDFVTEANKLITAAIDQEVSDRNAAISASATQIAKDYAAADTALKTELNTEIAKKYVKPSTGIAKTDLANEVQTSLGLADTALQAADLADYAKTADVESKIATAKTEAQNAVIGASTNASSADTVCGAKKYAEEKASAAQTAAINTASSDATTKADNALKDAKAYTDTRETAITTAYKDYADQAETDAKAYTDDAIAAEVTRSNGAYDAAGAAATAEQNAKNYADEIKATILGENDKLVTTYDTLSEIGQWIETTGSDVVDLAQDIIDEADAREAGDNALDAKITALQGTNHTHSNKALLDTYTQTEANLADAVSKKHSHANKAELDKIAEGDVAKWNAAEQNAKDHADGLVEAETAARGTAISGLQTQINEIKTTADGAIQEIATGTANGTIKVDGTDVAVKGLGSAAYTASTAYDAAGAAATAESNAKKYAEEKASAAQSAAVSAAAADAKAKIEALDVTVTGMGPGKTIATLTEVDGKIAATFQNISITKSQVSDFGNYDAAGTAQDKADAALDSAKNYTNTEIGKVNTKISSLTMDDIGSGTDAVVWVFDCGTSNTVM